VYGFETEVTKEGFEVSVDIDVDFKQQVRVHCFCVGVGLIRHSSRCWRIPRQWVKC
jgi:hypothetical protein